MTLYRTLAAKYTEQMRHHSHGYALYEPVSSLDLKPGSCGYFDENGKWATITQLNDLEKVKEDGYEAPVNLEVAQDKINRSWYPKCSEGVETADLELGIGIPETMNLPASAKAALRYTSSSEFGAILMTEPPVDKNALQHKAPFINWVRGNERTLLQKVEHEIKEYGLWIIRWTYTTKRASINAWAGTDKNVVIGFQASAFGTEFGPKGEWYKGRSDSAWDDYRPKEEEDKVVVMVGALRFRYSKSFWSWAQLKEEKGQKSAMRGDSLVSDPISLSDLHRGDVLLCEEVGADDESGNDED